MIDKIFKHFGLVPKSKIENAYNPDAIAASFARAANQNAMLTLSDGTLVRLDPKGGFGAPLFSGPGGFGYFSGYDVPTLELLRAAGGTFDPSAQQIIGQPRWNQLVYTSATTTSLSYFSTVSSGITGNQEIAGIIPNTKHYIVRSVRFFPVNVSVSFQTTNAVSTLPNDMSLLVNNAFFELTVISKSYLRLPLIFLPSGGGLWAALAATLTAPASIAVSSHGVPDPRSVWVLTNPLLLEGNINFSAIATWSAAQTLSGNATTMLAFDGQEIRPRQ